MEQIERPWKTRSWTQPNEFEIYGHGPEVWRGSGRTGPELWRGSDRTGRHRGFGEVWKDSGRTQFVQIAKF